MKHTTLIPSILAASLWVGFAHAGVEYNHIGSYEGHDYYVTDLSLEYYDAHEAAVQLGAELGLDAYLASVTSQEETDWIQSITTETMWIGLNDLDMDGIWTWDSGEAFDWSDWSPGEPNGHIEDENVVVMNQPFGDGGLGWNDWKDTNRFAFALIEVVPAPGALALLGLAGLTGRRRRR